MKARLEVKNTLIEEADKMDIKRLCWCPMNDKTIVDFPKLDLINMRCLESLHLVECHLVEWTLVERVLT